WCLGLLSSLCGLHGWAVCRGSFDVSAYRSAGTGSCDHSRRHLARGLPNGVSDRQTCRLSSPDLLVRVSVAKVAKAFTPFRAAFIQVSKPGSKGCVQKAERTLRFAFP